MNAVPDTIIDFPKWRQNSTPIEKLREVLQHAELHPECVQKLVLVWLDEEGDISWGVTDGMLNYETCGLLEMAKFAMLGSHTHTE